MPERIAQYCNIHLHLQNAELSEEYYYHSLPFCIIDAVYSLAARYSSTKNAVIRFCNVEGLPRLRQHGSPRANSLSKMLFTSASPNPVCSTISGIVPGRAPATAASRSPS